MNADGIHIPAMRDVQHRIVAALCNLYRHDGELLDVGANERSITHKLAEYLQREFPSWHVDCEYNRREGDPKTLPSNGAKKVVPDIIVHRRGTSTNLLVVEVKKGNGEGDTRDENKLTDFGNDPNYRYCYGLFLRVGNGGPSNIKLYADGSEEQSESKRLNGLIQGRLKELGYGE